MCAGVSGTSGEFIGWGLCRGCLLSGERGGGEGGRGRERDWGGEEGLQEGEGEEGEVKDHTRVSAFMTVLKLPMLHQHTTCRICNRLNVSKINVNHQKSAGFQVLFQDAPGPMARASAIPDRPFRCSALWGPGHCNTCPFAFISLCMRPPQSSRSSIRGFSIVLERRG